MRLTAPRLLLCFSLLLGCGQAAEEQGGEQGLAQAEQGKGMGDWHGRLLELG